MPSFAAPPSGPTCAFRPFRLRTEARTNPLGVQTGRPRLSWALEAATSPPARDARQHSYRIECFASQNATKLLWDSGRIESAETLHVPYDGPRLTSSQRVYWRVTSWDRLPAVVKASEATSGAVPNAVPDCEPSPLAWFETALLDTAAWHGAEWIARYADMPNVSECDLYAQSPRNQAPRFRLEVEVPTTAVGVRAYVGGLGYHRLFVDGKRAGESELNPGWTAVEKTVLYTCFDLSAQMTAGARHAVGLELGNGWWNPLPLRMWGHLNLREKLLGRVNGTREPIVRALFVAINADGTSTPMAYTSAKDGLWKTGGSPTTFNNIYLGEKFDARAAEVSAGWAQLGFDASGWGSPVVSAEAANLGQLVAQPMPPVRRQETLAARVVQRSTGAEPSGNTEDVVLLDVGRNIAGGCTYRLSGPAGSVVRMRYGELLGPDGKLNVMTSVAGQIKGPNPNAPCQPPLAYQADELTLSGRAGGDEWSSGAYSWHGFQFVEVHLPEGVKLEGDVHCYPMRTDVELVANVSTSSPALDRLHVLNRNTFDANMMSVQSDCPHRERFGYGGDALGCGEAGLSIYDWEAFYTKRVRDFNDAQRQATDASGELIVGFTETAPFVGISDRGIGPAGSGPIGWQSYQPEALLWLYKYYGAVDILHEAFNATHAFVRMLDEAGTAVEGGLGDWMPVDETSTAFTGLGFQRMSYLAFANISSIVGAPALEDEYNAKAKAVAQTMNARFLDESTGVYRTAAASGGARNDTQCGQGMALFTQLCPDAAACELAHQVLVDNARHATAYLPNACEGSQALPRCADAKGGAGAHLTAGLFGIKWVLMSLADGGENDLVMEMLTQQTYPSYGWMLNNPFGNATTLWESWFFSDNTFSHNHPMFASSEVWLLQSVAGIQPHPEAKGMDRVLIKPAPPTKLDACQAAFMTPRGRIAVSWKRLSHSGDKGEEVHDCGRARAPFALNVSIPPNVVATVHVPSASWSVHELGGLDVAGGRRITSSRRGAVLPEGCAAGGGVARSVALDIGSGEYAFETEVWL